VNKKLIIFFIVVLFGTIEVAKAQYQIINGEVEVYQFDANNVKKLDPSAPYLAHWKQTRPEGFTMTINDNWIAIYDREEVDKLQVRYADSNSKKNNAK
jgi:hypothetical protein